MAGLDGGDEGLVFLLGSGLGSSRSQHFKQEVRLGFSDLSKAEDWWHWCFGAKDGSQKFGGFAVWCFCFTLDLWLRGNYNIAFLP